MSDDQNQKAQSGKTTRERVYGGLLTHDDNEEEESKE